MNMFKKLFALVLALTLLLSLAVPAMADEHVHTIKIKETNPDHEYKAYQIFSGHVFSGDQDDDETTTAKDKVLKDVEWGANVAWDRAVSWKIGNQDVSLKLVQALQNATLNQAYYTYYGGIPHEVVVDTTAENYNPDFDTPKEIAAAVAKALASKSESAHANAFAKIVSKYLKADTEQAVANSAYKTTHYEINNLADGYYLVKEASPVTGETMTDYIMQLVADVEVEPKDGAVGVEKYILESQQPVKECSNAMGEDIIFWVEGTLPGNLAEFNNFYYAIEDTMDPGLAYVQDSLKVYTVNSDNAKQIVNPTTDPYYSATINGTSIKVVFADLKKLTNSTDYTLRSTTKIRLEYKAKLLYTEDSTSTTPNVVIGKNGNKNTVKIKFSNNPYAYDSTGTTNVGETSESQVRVFTFQLEVHKINGKTSADLPEVGFVLYREREGIPQYAVLAPDVKTIHPGTESKPAVTHINSGYIKGWTSWLTEQDLEVYMDNTDEYKNLEGAAYSAAKDSLMASPGVATTLKTNDKGILTFKGLDLNDLYWLKEVEKPDHFDAIDPVKLTITAGYNAQEYKVTDLKITIDSVPATGDNEAGKVSATVVNNPGNTLPSTGGMGTTVFYIVGAVLVLGAMVLLVTKKRMEN